MRRKHGLILVSGLVVVFTAFQVQAQKGVGDPMGVARQAVQPQVVSFSGTVKEVITKPCEMTTGRSVVGTHILLQTKAGPPLNIHLGPAASVGTLSKELAIGQAVVVRVFRTDKLPEYHYMAQSVTMGDETVSLRDENLRPVWASGSGAQKGRGGSQTGVGNRSGSQQRSGLTYGQGQGKGAGRGYRQGAGEGPGPGPGCGKGRGQGQGVGSGPCLRCEQQLGTTVSSLPRSELSEVERNALLVMREEEKLAHDVYVTLNEKWDLRPFANISQAEARHMSFVKMLLDRYGLDDTIDEGTIGKFPSQVIQDLYDQFVVQGEQSIEDAIKVGAEIEELDIADLRHHIDQTDNDDIHAVYQNLLQGSRNHLRAFARQISRYGTTYSAKHLSQAEFDRIASSDHERGMMMGNPNRGF